MTQIIVLTTEAGDLQNIGVIAGDISPQQAQAMCLAAARHFQELVVEAEVQRRLAAQVKGAKDNEVDQKADGSLVSGPVGEV